MARCKFFFLICLISLSPRSQLHADILHLELGVANTVENISPPYTSEYRFWALDKSMDELVRTHGTQGIIYLNDMDETGLQIAAAHARAWLQARKLSQIKIVPLAGNYNEIEIPQVTTANLINPGHNQLPSDSDLALRTNPALVQRLEFIAAHSETGLKIVSYFSTSMSFLAHYSKNSKLFASDKYAEPYRFPNGKIHESMPYAYYLVPIDRMKSVIPKSDGTTRLPQICADVLRKVKPRSPDRELSHSF